MKKVVFFLLASISFCVMLNSCSTSVNDSSLSQTVSSKDLFAMDTYMNLKAYGGDAEQALSQASDRVFELEKKLSVTDEGSDIWKVNHASGQPVSVSDDTIKIVNTAMEIGNKSNGALNIALYPVLQAWGFTTSEYHIPDNDELNKLLQKVDYTKISVDNDENTISLPEGYQIDFGALAKGYTGDELMEIMKVNGITSAIVNLGGNVQTLGSKPDGSKWNVAIQNPFSTDEEICIVSVENKAVITSGNYERYFIGEDGNKYWHIIDASDGYPADNGIISMTVIGDSGLLCDALSTALFVLGTDYAIEYWRTNGGFDMIFVTDTGKLFLTEGIKDSFQYMGDSDFEVISS